MLGRVGRAATLGDGGLVGRTGRMLEKSRGLRFEKDSGDVGGEFGGRIAEKSRVGCWGRGGTVGTGRCLGRSCANMFASCVNALFVSVPKVAKGVAGAGFRSKCIKSSAVAFAMSTEDVAGISTWCGKNSTVSLVRTPFVLGIYTL